MGNTESRRLAESAILIAVGTVLSLFSFQGPWVLGGSITVCSMLPLVMIAYRHGTQTGIFSALVYSVIQMLLGISNVQYAPDAQTAVWIVLLDYIIAFSVIGFAGCFKNVMKDARASLVIGILVTFSARLLCHFLSGYFIWEALYPNGQGYTSALWSICYNGSYMVPEMILTAVVAFVSFIPLKKYWLGEDLQK